MKILSKKNLAPSIKQLIISAPDISAKALPGQFVILRVCQSGERIPLTIASNNLAKGTITVVFQEVGKTTRLLGKLTKGDFLCDLAGPLGKPTEIKKFGNVIGIGGGVGIAELLPVVRALKEAGNKVTCIIGVRSAEFIIFEKELRDLSDKFLIATDDGSMGDKGTAGDLLRRLLNETPSRCRGTAFPGFKWAPSLPDYVYAVGPVLMMRNICEITKTVSKSRKSALINTVVSLNPIMIDGTGMCGSCRVTVGGEAKFACIDGPEFDGHSVEWDELAARLKFFSVQEKISNDSYKE